MKSSIIHLLPPIIIATILLAICLLVVPPFVGSMAPSEKDAILTTKNSVTSSTVLSSGPKNAQNFKQFSGILVAGSNAQPIITAPALPATNNLPSSTLIIPEGYKDRFPLGSQAVEDTICNTKLRPFFAGLRISLLDIHREPRASIVGSHLELTMKDIGPGEITALLIHEGAHHYDLRQDAQLQKEFQNISWQNPTLKKKEASLSHFVSGYALSNAYEDFAETATFYVLFQEEFKKRALDNRVLNEKYNFFKNSVFGQGQFHDTDYASGSINSYNWDATKIIIDQKKYAKQEKQSIITSSCFELQLQSPQKPSIQTNNLRNH